MQFPHGDGSSFPKPFPISRVLAVANSLIITFEKWAKFISRRFFLEQKRLLNLIEFTFVQQNYGRIFFLIEGTKNGTKNNLKFIAIVFRGALSKNSFSKSYTLYSSSLNSKSMV